MCDVVSCRRACSEGEISAEPESGPQFTLGGVAGLCDQREMRRWAGQAEVDSGVVAGVRQQKWERKDQRA